MLLDDTDSNLDTKEVIALREHAAKRFFYWRKRALYAAAGFCISCALVFLFLEGQPLHYKWDAVGKYLLFLPMALLPILLLFSGLCWGAWQLRRSVDR